MATAPMRSGFAEINERPRHCDALREMLLVRNASENRFGGIKMILELPDEVSKHLPQGHEPTPGVKLVLPMHGAHGIAAVNEWLRAEDWYPSSLKSVVWFGDDGTGNLFGWKPKERTAIL